MGATPKSVILASFVLALLVCFCLFALIPQLAQHDTPRKLPVRRTAAQLYVEPPPEPEKPPEPQQPKVEKQQLQQTPQPQIAPKPRLLQPPEFDFRPPDINIQMATGVVPVPPADLSGIYQANDLDCPPSINFHVKPIYPYRAKRMNITGYVKIQFDVGRDGHVGTMKILESVPPGVFDDAVLQVVQKWRFQPGEIMGDQVATRMVKKIVFNLED
ncbi:outer membrane transport energization protein TonB [Desulfuromusa kysingii]|uniref:Protein TonB n=1 Tax=Desulfuromusa kysingii TaxID=37625 RepID=A0A1H3VT15_9BACT|nr:energy transducer TonB [Desulfuromusa kysingii]SDZ77910.1 outer membrane transport energization protein TonB [Desulfuromusa kysingii]